MNTRAHGAAVETRGGGSGATSAGAASGAGRGRPKERRPARVATPWGAATVVEEARVQQRGGERRFASLVQLLELPQGEQLVRFAYTTDGTVRRGPVTLRERDVARLWEQLEQQPRLRELLGS